MRVLQLNLLLLYIYVASVPEGGNLVGEVLRVRSLLEKLPENGY